MSIRAFINTWAEEALGNGLIIKDPIDEYLADITLSQPVEAWNYYARISTASKRPDRIYLLKIMRGNLQSSEWDALSALPGVKAIPPASLNLPIANINKPTENKIYGFLDDNGIDRSVYDSASTVGGFLRNLLSFTNPDLTDFGDLENTPNDWA